VVLVTSITTCFLYPDHFTFGLPAGEADQAVHLIIAEGLEAYLPLADMVDIGKEVERLQKQAAKLQADFDSNTKRLSSSKVSKLNRTLSAAYAQNTSFNHSPDPAHG
jgi:valyl-tRNA synthetase